MRTIRHSDAGDAVRVAQLLMKWCSPYDPALSVYTANFTAYVVGWQRRRGLDPDGVIGPKTWAAMAAEAPTCSVNARRSGQHVAALQAALGGLDQDGVFGPKTRAAVLAYQAARGLHTDGICGPKTWAALLTGAELHADADESAADSDQPTGKWINECVHYLQWDARWKSVKYSTHTSSQTIGNSGCGPTAMAMIMATFVDAKITPVEMCALAVSMGCRTYNSGTSWDFFPQVFKRYEGFAQYVSTDSLETLKAALKQGALAVCSMNNGADGFWTNGGHFVTVIGYDSEGNFYANDPNKSAAPRKQHEVWFKECLKQAFIFWPKAEDKTGELASETCKSQDNLEITPDAIVSEKTPTIIDISKWDYPIDFMLFGPDLAIARAACGSDPDPRFGEYATRMTEKGIPFGVYGYSYAATTAKAEDEAEKLWAYASGFDPLFYVYDIEEARNTRAAVEAWAARMRAMGVKRIGAYLGKEVYDRMDFDGFRGLFDFIWYARYGKNTGSIPGEQYRPHYRCDLWQYTSKGRVPGIGVDVDLNVITGEGHDLKWFCGGDEV